MKSQILGFGAIALALVVGLGIARYVGAGNPPGDMADIQVETPYASVEVGGLTISDYWIAESLGAQPNTAAYMTITSAAGTDDRLVAVRADFANMASLHRTVTEDGTSRMEGLTAVIIPAGGTVTLAPGATHLMLMGLADPLEANGEAELTLVFLDAGEVTFPAPVRSRTDMMDHGGGQ